jgi:hypothetical protein
LTNVLSTTRGRVLAIGALIALIAAALFATQASSPEKATAKRADNVSQVVARIDASGSKLRLVFSGDHTVGRGDLLRFKSLSNPRAVGPHSFTFVRPNLRPDTKSERKNCFTPGHICLKAAGWHGVHDQNDPIRVNPVETGRLGFDWEGNLGRKGDSWIALRRNAQITRVVSAPAGTTLHFMCIIHPNMHFDIHVTH